MQRLIRLDDALGRLEDLFLIAATAIIVSLVGLGVVLRYVFNDPLVWSEEFVVTLFVWTLMIGFPSALRSHLHIRIDVLILRVGTTGQRALGSLSLLASVAVLVGAIYAGVMHTQGVWSSRTPMLDFSMGWIFVSLPIGFSLALVHMARLLTEGGPESVFRSETELVVETAAKD